MNKKLARVLSLLFCLLLLVSASDTKVYAIENNIEEDSVYYCREALRSLPNSDALLYAYDSIVMGVEASLESISVFDGEHAISIEEISTVIDAYTRDHTEHFWLGKEYSLTVYQQSRNVTHFNPSYTMSGEELADARARFDEAITELVAYASEAETEYEKELILHDRLATRIQYSEGTNAHDAYGALVLGEAVCEGYAKALQCLLHKVGIESLIVTGFSINPSTELPEGHAWNIVRIDGKYYHTDLTWNDQQTALFHAFFNLSDTVIKEDHTIDEANFALPVCNSDDANYFAVEGGCLTEYSADAIAKRFTNGNLTTNIYINGSIDEFKAWCNTNYPKIAEKLGIRTSYYFFMLTHGHEAIIQFEVCEHKNLTFVPQKPVSCTEDGNYAYYLCECGSYFYDDKATQSVLTPSILFIPSHGHSFTKSEESEQFLKNAPENCLSAYTYWNSCSRCGEISDSEYFESERRGAHSPGAPATEENAQTCTLCGDELAPKLHSHSLTLVSRKEPTCTEAGKKEYYTCECGKSFIDSEAKGELINLDNYGGLGALGHQEAGFDGKCARCGRLIKPINTLSISITLSAFSLILFIGITVSIKKKRK